MTNSLTVAQDGDTAVLLDEGNELFRTDQVRATFSGKLLGKMENEEKR
jgi:hypothetical protein